MATAQVTLTDAQTQALQALSQSQGKTQEEILKQAVEQFLTQHTSENRHASESSLDALRQAHGIWQEREDLSPLTELYSLRGTPVDYQQPTEPVAEQEWESLA